MLNFTIGPVQMCPEVLEIAGVSTPYFRTEEFSSIMIDNERLMLRFAAASDADKCIFLTGSGTAAMEAAVVNTLTTDDNVLIVDGGSFGHRFTEICDKHRIPYTAVTLKPGFPLEEENLIPYDGMQYTAFIVNLHETSTAVLYDINLISKFCKRNNLFLIVDAVSSFIADDINFSEDNIDVMITGSQKALAVQPGISIALLSEAAQDRISRIDSGCIYLDFKSALINAERGQTPFTPAVTTLLQINKRLHMIDESGGVAAERNKIKKNATDFRSKIKRFPFDFFSKSPSNAVTSLYTAEISAKGIFDTLKNEYGIWVCPNGGDMEHTVFRVGHLGYLSINDNDTLIAAIDDMFAKGKIIKA